MPDNTLETVIDLHVDAPSIKKHLPTCIQKALSAKQSHIRVLAKEAKRGYVVKKTVLLSMIYKHVPKRYQSMIERLKQCTKKGAYTIIKTGDCDFVISAV